MGRELEFYGEWKPGVGWNLRYHPADLLAELNPKFGAESEMLGWSEALDRLRVAALAADVRITFRAGRATRLAAVAYGLDAVALGLAASGRVLRFTRQFSLPADDERDGLGLGPPGGMPVLVRLVPANDLSHQMALEAYDACHRPGRATRRDEFLTALRKLGIELAWDHPRTDA